MRKFKKILSPLLSLLICVSVFVSAPLSSSALLQGTLEDVFVASDSDTYSLNTVSSAYDNFDMRQAPSGANRLPYPFSQFLTYGNNSPFSGVVDGYSYSYSTDDYVRFTGTASTSSWFYLFRDATGPGLYLSDTDADFYLNCFTHIYSGSFRVVVQGYNAAGVMKQVAAYPQSGFTSVFLEDFASVSVVALAFSAGSTFDISFRCSLSDLSNDVYSRYYKTASFVASANYNTWQSFSMNNGIYYGFVNGFGNVGTVIPAIYGYEYYVTCKIGFATDYNTDTPDFTVVGVQPSAEALDLEQFNVVYTYGSDPQYPSSFDADGGYVAWADVSFSFKTMDLDLPDEIALDFQTVFLNTYSVAQFILLDFKVQAVDLVPSLVENSVSGILGILNGTFIPGGGSDQIEDLNDRNQNLTDSANNQQSGFVNKEELEKQYRENLLQYRNTAAFGDVSSQIRSFVLQYYDGFAWWRGALDEILSFGPVIGLVSISVFVSCFFLLIKLAPSVGWFGRRERSRAEANERAQARNQAMIEREARRQNQRDMRDHYGHYY